MTNEEDEKGVWLNVVTLIVALTVSGLIALGAWANSKPNTDLSAEDKFILCQELGGVAKVDWFASGDMNFKDCTVAP